MQAGKQILSSGKCYLTTGFWVLQPHNDAELGSRLKNRYSYNSLDKFFGGSGKTPKTAVFQSGIKSLLLLRINFISGLLCTSIQLAAESALSHFYLAAQRCTELSSCGGLVCLSVSYIRCNSHVMSDIKCSSQDSTCYVLHFNLF